MTAGAAKLGERLSALRAERPASNTSDQRVQDAVDLLHELLPEEHPVLRAVRAGVGVHHAGLPRAARAAIEQMFSLRALDVLAATSTLVQGVNLPVKTLILADYCSTRRRDKHTGSYNEEYALSKRDFHNIAGRAGRALYETEGQVIFIESLEHYPKVMRRGFADYLESSQDSPELAVTSSLSEASVIESLAELVGKIDGDRSRQLTFWRLALAKR
jgi:replicative superfamily II helicase